MSLLKYLAGMLNINKTSNWGDSLHDMSKPIFGGKQKKNISKCCLLKYLPDMLSVNKTSKQL